MVDRSIGEGDDRRINDQNLAREVQALELAVPSFAAVDQGRVDPGRLGKVGVEHPKRGDCLQRPVPAQVDPEFARFRFPGGNGDAVSLHRFQPEVGEELFDPVFGLVVVDAAGTAMRARREGFDPALHLFRARKPLVDRGGPPAILTGLYPEVRWTRVSALFAGIDLDARKAAIGAVRQISLTASDQAHEQHDRFFDTHIENMKSRRRRGQVPGIGGG